MDRKSTRNYLPLLALSLGVTGWGLRQALYGLALDDRGLLITGHPLEIGLWCLTVLALGGFGWYAWKQAPGGSWEENFPPSFLGGAGQVLFGAGILLTVLLEQPLTQYLGTLWRVLGYLSFPCLLAAAFCRVRGRKPFFLLHLIPCLFLVLHIIDHYRYWSSNPQLQDYVFSLFSSLCLMLFAFYQVSFDVELPHRRMLTAVGLGGIYLTAVSMEPGRGLFLSLGAIAWTVTGLCHKKGE